MGGLDSVERSRWFLLGLWPTMHAPPGPYRDRDRDRYLVPGTGIPNRLINQDTNREIRTIYSSHSPSQNLTLAPRSHLCPRQGAHTRGSSKTIFLAMLPGAKRSPQGEKHGTEAPLRWGAPYLEFLLRNTMSFFPSMSISLESLDKVSTTIVRARQIILGWLVGPPGKLRPARFLKKTSARS